MKKRPLIGIRLLALITLVPWCIGRGQELEFRDIPPSGITPDTVRKAPLSVEARKDFEESLGAHDFQRAETILVKEIDRDPKSPQLLNLAGAVFFLDTQYLNSAIAMKKADALAPLDESSRFTLAMAYVKLNHRDWARPELERLARTDPKNALFPYWLSRLDYDAMHFESAVNYVHKALALNSKFMKAYDQLGLCDEALGKYDEAIAAYRTAAGLNNEGATSCSPWPSLDLATLLTKLGQLAEAEESLKKSLQCDSKLARAHYQLGLLLQKQLKYDAAVEELKQAASLDANFPEPHYALGQIYQKKGDPQNAAMAWATFQKLKKSESHDRPR